MPAPDGEILIRSRGRLPHWESHRGAYFVTFRLDDSLPQSLLESYDFERQDILAIAQRQGRELTPAERRRLDELFAERIDKYLDSGVGACYLARTEIAELVADALRYFEGQRYRLEAWCVMPNHVHTVFTAFLEQSLESILHSWKSFSAKQANKLLNTTGRFWQREYYDRLVRNDEELRRFIRYVAENPLRAHLSNWRWVWARISAGRL